MLGADSESQDVSIDDLLDIAAPEEYPEEEPTDQKGLFQRVFGNVINDEIAEEERKAQEEEEQKAAEKAELAEQKKAEKEQAKEAKKAEIDFFSTPFDNTSVDFLEEIGIGFYKIASFELVDIPLIEYVASTGKPMILSTGMATLAEIDEAVEAVKKQGNHNFALLRCASAYPAITDEMNLRTMQNMGDTFGVPYGLSDHSMGSVGAVTAVALGASIIEKHFCLDRSIENPDSTFSMNPMEFKQMVHDIRQAERAIGSVKYGPSEQEKNNLQFRRSIFCVKDIQEGEKLTEENIRIIRPGYGLAPKFYKDVLGQTALEDIQKGTPLAFEMIGK